MIKRKGVIWHSIVDIRWSCSRWVILCGQSTARNDTPSRVSSAWNLWLGTLFELTLLTGAVWRMKSRGPSANPEETRYQSWWDDDLEPPVSTKEDQPSKYEIEHLKWFQNQMIDVTVRYSDLLYQSCKRVDEDMTRNLLKTYSFHDVIMKR